MFKFSYSKLNMYRRCGEQYRRRYIENEILLPGIALIRGSSLHKGAELMWRYKALMEGQLRRKQDILDEVRTTFENRIIGGIHMTKEEKSKKGKVISTNIDHTLKLSELFCEKVAPVIQPKDENSIERRFMVPIGRDFLVIGVMDLIDNQERIEDLKSTEKEIKQREIDTSDQMSTYWLDYLYEFGKEPKGMFYDILVGKDLKKGYKTEHKSLSTKRTKEQIQKTINKFYMARRGIEHGVFLPADPRSWICSERWCGYWWTCKYGGGK